MTSQQGQLQALINEIEALLGRAAPKLPWMVSGEVGEQRRVMEQALTYLKDLQGTADSTTGWGLVANASGAIAPPTQAPNRGEAIAGEATEANSQQVLQALLQEMQYLRAQMVQPLTSEVIALQQQRETLKNEVRQLEQERQQRAQATADQPQPAWVSEIVEQLRLSLLEQLTPQLQALQGSRTDYPALYGGEAPELLMGADDLPQLTPQQRLEQLRQIQSQTDGMLLKLDGNLRAVFESLDQSIQSYCDTLNQGLDAMHGLGQQGEFIFRAFVNHLAEQLQDEGSELANRLAISQERARLQGQLDDDADWPESDEWDAAAIAESDELMNAVVDLDDVDLDDLDDLEDLDVDEEVTLFQLDEEFEDLPLEVDIDEDEAIAVDDDDLDSDDSEQTVIQTEPISWEMVTGQAAESIADGMPVSKDAPAIAYTQEIDALYDSLFGNASETETASAPVSETEAEDAALDEQLLNTDNSELAAPQITDNDDVERPEVKALDTAETTSLDLDFLLEADDSTTEPLDAAAATASTAPPLEDLLGAEMAAELSPDDSATGTATPDTITSLTELLPESEQAQGARQADPFATFDETDDTFIPAPPDENLLDTSPEVTRPQVELTLDDATLGQLSSDLSRLEGDSLNETFTDSLADSLLIEDLVDDDLSAADSETVSDQSDHPSIAAEEIALPATDDNLEEAATSVLDEAISASDLDADFDLTSDSDDASETTLSSSIENDLDSATESASTLTDSAIANYIDWDAAETDDSAEILEPGIDLQELVFDSDAIAEPTVSDEADEAVDALRSVDQPEATGDRPEVVEDTGDAGSETEAETDWLAAFDLSADTDQSVTDGEDEDILPMLELDDFDPFAETPPKETSDAASSLASEIAGDPSTRLGSTTADDDASVENFIDDFLGSGDQETAPSTQADDEFEAISLDTVFDDTAPAGTNAATPPSDSAESDLFEAFAQEATPTEPIAKPTTSEADDALTLDNAFEAALTPDDLAATDAEASEPPISTPDLTLDNAFGEEPVSDNLVDPEVNEPPVRESGLTLDNAFGEEPVASDLADPEVTEPAASESGLTLDNAFDEEPVADDLADAEVNEPPASESGLTLDNAFGEESVADDLADSEVTEPPVSTPDLTLDSAFGESAIAPEFPEAIEDSLTADNAFGEAPGSSKVDQPMAPDSPADDASSTVETLDDFADSVANSPRFTPEPDSSVEGLFDEPLSFSSESDFSLTLEDIDFETDRPDAPAGDSDLTLEAELFPSTETNSEDTFSADSESVPPDSLTEGLEIGDLPEDISPVADDFSLASWGDAFDAPETDASDPPPATLGELDLDFTVEAEPDDLETSDTPTADDLFSGLADTPPPTIAQSEEDAEEPAPTMPEATEPAIAQPSSESADAPLTSSSTEASTDEIALFSPALDLADAAFDDAAQLNVSSESSTPSPDDLTARLEQEAIAESPDINAGFWSPVLEDRMANDFANAIQSAADSNTAKPVSAPLTDDELATFFPPQADAETDTEATEDTGGPAQLLDEEASDRSDDATETFTASLTDAPPTSSEPETDDAGLDLPTNDTSPAGVAATEPIIAATDLARESEPALPPNEANETASDLDGSLEDLDLPMEEMSESEIASDEAFRTAFQETSEETEESESTDETSLSAEAIADLDALTADQAIVTEAREPAPEEESAPDEEPATPSATAAVADESVFASSGMLTFLGSDAANDPDAEFPDGVDDAETAAPEAWFLGIDLGSSGLSAVLMEQHSGSAHPLCWVATETTQAERTANFRMPAVVAVQADSDDADTASEIVAIGQSAASHPAEMSDQWLLHTLRPLLRVGIPHQSAEGQAAPILQWSDDQTVPLSQVVSAVRALLRLINQPAEADLRLEAIGLETSLLEEILTQLQGVVVGLPTNWSDTYCFNMREAVLAAGLVESPSQVFFVEEAIAAILSGLPDPNEPPADQNRQVQTLYQCNWQGGTVVISGGASCTEVGIVDLPQPLDALSREDFRLRNLAYGGDALDLDIICQLLVPPERRQTANARDRRPANRGWGWQAALPEVANARWADLEMEAFDLPQLAEPDPANRQRLRQHLEASKLGQSLLEAARYLKLILQNQNQYQLELADQSWRVLRRDLESRVLVPYIQRINQQVNALLSQTGLASQGINQVICTGGNASFSTIAKWLRQKFPNATIIQDTYPSNRPQTCSRVAYGLVNLCRYPQVLDVPRHQYSDYFLLHEMLRVIPDAPLPFDGILHVLEEQGLNIEVCQSRIAAILEGHLPPGLLPDLTTREVLSRETVTSSTYQNLAAGSLFSKQTRNIYMVNAVQRDRLSQHLATLMQDKQQSWSEPLIAQLVAV